jgi:fatty acid desaturase
MRAEQGAVASKMTLSVFNSNVAVVPKQESTMEFGGARPQSAKSSSRSPLPAPPRPPAELFELNLDTYAPHLALSVALTGAFASLAHVVNVPLIGALAGVCAVPLIFFQHDVGHAMTKRRTPTHENIASAIALITGTYWGAGPWRVHTRHHCRTGDYYTWMLPDVNARMGGDLDDFLGPLRGGNPLGAHAAKSPFLRAAVVVGSIAAALFTFQVMFVIQALSELQFLGQHKPGSTYESRKRHDERIILGAVITAVHLLLGSTCLGPMGYMAFSVGMSGGLQIFAAGFHQPSGVANYSEGHYYDRQIESATNLKLPDNPFFHFLIYGNGGNHIEHHLWENVPVINLGKLTNVSKEYCKLNELDYREVTFTEAWSAWLKEGWRLSGLVPQDARNVEGQDRC